MKKLYLFAALAAMLAACSENDLTAEKQAQQTEGQAIAFDAYTNRTTTRAGWVGTVNTAGLQTIANATDLGKSGFGVFGYYTDNASYDQQQIPNFMYNQQVTWNGQYFEYNPVKYWPNEFGKSAESDDQDKVSFFAYAPYVLVNPSTGKAVNANGDGYDMNESAELQKWGINSLSRNTANGDPIVKYITSFDQDKSVDLCWGVCDDINWPKIVDGSNQQINKEKGFPWLNVLRPADPTALGATTGQKVKFTFKHATAQLKVMIDAFVDSDKPTTNKLSDSKNKTKVFVRSITFEGFATKGALNLNNIEKDKAYWLDFNGSNDLVNGESVTIYDGRKDGKEGMPSGVASNEKTLGLNPDIISNDGNKTSGVTETAANLFRKWDAGNKKYIAADGSIFVIPTGDPVKVTIVYDVETEDPNLSTYLSDCTTTGSSIENCITKTINFGASDIETFKNGKSYTINLHLGLNSVKFDAAVTDWVETSAADVDLPANIPMYAAVASPDYTNINLPADVTSYQFGITGLNGYESVAVTHTASDNLSAPTTNSANAAGVAIEKVTITPNTKVKTAYNGGITWLGTSTSKGVKFDIKQAPHALGLGVSCNETNLSLWTSANGQLDWNESGLIKKIQVWRNGVELSPTTGDLTSTTYKVTYQTSSATRIGQIDFTPAATTGDVFTVTIQAGDAPEETSTVKK